MTTTLKSDAMEKALDSLIRPMMRAIKRESLKNAIEGTSVDRYNYAVTRAMLPDYNHLVVYGTTLINRKQIKKRISSIVNRLERIANATKSTAPVER